MRRPMFVIGVSFSVAMWAAFYFALPLHHNLFLAAGLSVLAVLFSFAPSFKHRRMLIVILFSAGIAFGAYYNYNVRSIAPFTDISKDSLYINGMITEVKPSSGQATRYTLSAIFPQDNLPASTVYAYQFGEIEFDIGDIISGELKPFPPKSPLIANNMRQAGVVLCGSLTKASQSSSSAFELSQKLLFLRQSFCDNLFKVMPMHIAEFEQGIIFGLVGEIPEEVYSSMQRSGTLHLLAVSGYHLAVLAGLIIFLLRRTPLPLRLQYLIAWLFCLCFVLLTGFSPSLSRSLIMISVILCARVISRRADTLNSLGLSLFIICFLQPSWILGYGLWYSALSCAGIAVVAAPSTDKLTRILKANGHLANICIDAFSVSFGAYLFTLPITFIQNGWIPTFSPLANLFVTPFVPLTLIGGMLCAVLPVGVISSVIAAAVSAGVIFVNGVSQVFSALPFAVIAFDRLWLLFLLAALIAGIVVLYRRGGKLLQYSSLLCSLALVLSLGLLLESALMQSRAELVLIGEENLPLIIRGKSAVLLAPPSQHEVGNVLRYLEFRGIDEIDALFAANHNGKINSGITRLYERYPIHCAIAPADEYTLSLLSQAMPGINVYPANYSELTVLGGIKCSFDVLGNPVLQIGSLQTFSYRVEYDTMLNETSGAICVYKDTVLLPDGISPTLQLVGSNVFDETRIFLTTEG